jgi:hypothetical protein
MRKSYLNYLGLVILLLVVGKVGQAQDSLGMSCLSSLDYWDDAGDIQMVGDLAYITAGLSGLHIMSLADSANPVEVGRYTWYPWNVSGGVYVTGNRAYLCLSDTGIVLDVSDPANLVTLGEWGETPGGGIADITLVYGDIAIAETEEGYPYILDVSDPTNVHYIGEFTEELGHIALGMADEYLCMMGWPGGVILYDISDPTQPQRVAACDTASQAWDGTLSGNYAYIASFDGLHIIDLTNPLQPSLIAVCDSGAGLVTITGAHAIITYEGLHIWNITDPAHPVFEGVLECPPGSYGFISVSSSGNLVSVGNLGEKVVEVVEISNPTTPAIVSEFGNYGVLEQLVVSGTIGYVADLGVGLRTIDLCNPNQTSELANLYNHSFSTRSVAIQGDYAYEAVRYWRLFVVDISNPAQPESLWCLGESPQNCKYLKLLTVGNYLYAFDFHSTGPSYIQTFYLTNPEIPEWVDSLAIPQLSEAGFFDVTAWNGYIYLVQNNYFKVFSLANPAAPQLVGSCGLPVPNLYARALSVVATGNYAYVANNGGGIVVVDITNLSNPTVVTSMEGYYSEVAVIQDVLFADNRFSGIYVMDISNPTNPINVGYYFTHEDIRDMEAQGEYLFTTSPSEFRVYQVDALTGVALPVKITPNKFKLYPCYPNPFNPSTVIRFSLPYTALTKLTIYDVTGRQVKVLTNEVLNAGDHRLTFNGSSLSSGVYFIRLEAGHHMQTEKLILLK